MINQAALSGALAEKKAKRFTPAGLPVLELILAHESEVTEAGLTRKITFEVKAKAVGPVAERIEQVSLGRKIRATGFLAPSRQHSKQISFHMTDFELE